MWMLSEAKQVVFKLDIEGFPHDLQVLEFRAKERLNQPYAVKLELVSERPDLGRVSAASPGFSALRS